MPRVIRAEYSSQGCQGPRLRIGLILPTLDVGVRVQARPDSHVNRGRREGGFAVMEVRTGPIAEYTPEHAARFPIVPPEPR
jgi:hypothetical protein